MPTPDPAAAAALARLYDLDLAVDPGDLDLYRALARRTGGPIVELCAGTGRVAVPLAADGHAVTAIDVDPASLARASTRAAAAGPATSRRLHPLVADLFDADLPGGGTFHLAILALNSILLLGGPRRQREAVGVMARLLAPGGVAVVDAWLPLPDEVAGYDGRLGLEWVRRDAETGFVTTKLAAAWYDAAARIVTLTTIFDEGPPGEPIRRWVREDALHLLAAEELRLHAEDAGLVVEVVAGDHDLSPLRPGDGRAVLVARRPASP